VIRLKDREVASSQVDGVELGIDPGSKLTCVAVFRANNTIRAGLFAIEVRHRGGQIRDKLNARAVFRRGRRSRNLRYRAPRFLNRREPDGWLAPSLRHRVAFDTQLLQNPNIAGVEYQHGTLDGYEVREHLLAKWGRRRAYCGATGVPLNIDHIVPPSRGGSDRPAVSARIRGQAKLPLRDAAAVPTTRRALGQALAATGLPLEVGTGGRTKWNRHQTGAPKTPTLDAFTSGSSLPRGPARGRCWSPPRPAAAATPCTLSFQPARTRAGTLVGSLCEPPGSSTSAPAKPLCRASITVTSGCCNAPTDGPIPERRSGVSSRP
ncbi:RRXRR domain-containing protein, partial [Micromonospora sp. NPDC007271]|uniref:RRXRR domain-containing protein n=1 Tax=Micromonospora sp. NPDC007271 TaxID=3154587 RepID=UPI0033F2FEE5